MYHLFLILSLLYVNAQNIATAVANNTEFRSFVASVNSETNSISLAGVKASLSADGTHAVSGNQDAAAFKFVAAGSGSTTPQVAIGHTILSASASVSWAPTPQGGSLIYPVPDSWAETMAGFNNLILYKEGNGVPGLQYDIGDNVWDCTVSNGKDCFLPNSNIDLTKDVIWSPLSSTSLPCPPSTGYSSNCSIWKISSTASLVQSGTSVLKITLKLASQNVLTISSTNQSSQIGPDILKFDLNITYPWDDKAQNKSIGKVALGGYAGGKALTGISNGSYQSKQAWIFPGDNGKSAVLAFDASATADGIVKSTNLFGISGAAITASNNSIQNSLSLAVTTQWKSSIALASPAGWLSQLFFLSWDLAGPTLLDYDPVVGSTDSSNSSTSNSTNSTVPSPAPSPQPPAYSPPQPPAYSKPQPSSGSQPQPPSGPQPQPPSGPQPQSPSGPQPQPSSGTQPQSPSGTQPPPAGTQPPPAGTQPPPAGTQPPPSGTQPSGQPTQAQVVSGSLFLAPTLFTCLLCLIFYGLF